MQGIHSPDEVLYLDSVERVFKALAQLIVDWNVA
jgi:acetylornithine deacetylase/succinyl-diaminopimelate desuccinylase-like protein